MTFMGIQVVEVMRYLEREPSPSQAFMVRGMSHLLLKDRNSVR